jgi:hypothetical protein
MGITTMLRHVLKPPWFDHTRDGEQVRGFCYTQLLPLK